MIEEDKHILIRFIVGECSADEERQVLNRLEGDKAYRKEYARFRDIFFCVGQTGQTGSRDLSRAMADIFRRTIDRKPERGFRWRRYAGYAAALLLFATAGIVFLHQRQPLPGHRELAQCVVPDGACERIVLPDSSVVWINGGTTLRYAKDFGVHERWVELDGEAYFEVTHHPEIPFMVDMKDFQIRVFGTKFNVNSYQEDQRAEAVLDEGHIGVRLKSADDHFIDLQPRQKIVFDRKGQTLTKEAATDSRSWKDGFLIFNQDSFDRVVKKMERRYGVKIKVEKTKDNNYLYTGTFAAESLTDLLKAIDFLTPIEYTLNPGEVLISFR